MAGGDRHRRLAAVGDRPPSISPSPIATGGWRRAATAKLTAAGIDAAALPMACANDALSREEIVTTARRRAEDAHGIEAFERVVYVGDGVWDVRTCAALEMPLVGMAVTVEVRERLIGLGVSHVLDDYRDVAAALVALETAEVPGSSGVAFGGIERTTW